MSSSPDRPGPESGSPAPKLMHVTTVDLSLELLLKPQLLAFAAAGYDVVGVSAPGPYVGSLEAAGLRHVAVASESVALEGTGMVFDRDIKPGEAVFIDLSGKVHADMCADNPVLSPYMFEYVYLTSSD